jgi:NADP-dependent 3-hydroxy acid dehydrogenase YdfG
VAGALAEQGESLILAGRDSEKLARARQLLSQKSASVDTVVLDISKEEEVIQLSQTLGEVDNIIVTAGSHAPGGALTSLNLNEARLAFDTKFWGSIHVARHLSKNISPAAP